MNTLLIVLQQQSNGLMNFLPLILIIVVFWSASSRITFNTSPVSSGSSAEVGSSKHKMSG